MSSCRDDTSTDHGVIFLVCEEPFCQRSAKSGWGNDVNLAFVWFVYAYADTKLEFIRRYYLSGFLREKLYPPHGRKAIFLGPSPPLLLCFVVLYVGFFWFFSLDES